MISRLRAMKPHELAAAAFRLREIGIVIALAAVVIFFGVRATNFLTVENWQDIAKNVSIVLVVAVGETMVILTRNIDLSVGSIVGLSGYLVAATLKNYHGIPVEVVALIGIAIGLGLGIVNGLLVAVARIPAIIATLATLAIFRGIDAELTGGENITAYQLPDRFLQLAGSKPAGVPALAWIAIGVAIVGAATLRWAPWARDFYAIGSNPDAARFAGIPAGRRVITAFALSGALAGLGGFLFASRFPTLDSGAANGFELTVITAVVIGGVNVFGGSGTILGVVIGAVLVATISNGFTLLRLDEFWKIFFNGFAIVAAVTIDALVTKRLQEALRRRRAELVAAPRTQAGA
jgi:rhamnose transport system permease protein